MALSPELSGTLLKSNYKLPCHTRVIQEYSPDTNESNTNLMTRDKNMDMPPLLSRYPSSTPPTTTTITTQFYEKLCPPGDTDCYRTTYFHGQNFAVYVAFGGMIVVLIFAVCFAYLYFKYSDRRDQRRHPVSIDSSANGSTHRTSRDDKLNPFAGDIV